MSRKNWPLQTKFLHALFGMGKRLAPAGIDRVLAPSPRWIQVTRPTVGIPRLPGGWDGATIAILSDLHIGRFIRLPYVRRVMEIVQSLAPDLVALAGDYLIRNGELAGEILDCFRSLRAPLGVFAVLGNHDHWHRPKQVRAALESAGIVVLVNSHRMISRGGAALCLAGVDDAWESRADVAAALAGAPEEAPHVLLRHNPDFAELLPPAPRVDLMLSGHTHGGQVRLPFLTNLLAPIRHKKYLQGLVRGPRCPVYVCRGAGAIGIPLRFRCPPEITLLTLRRRAPADPGI
jgi:predicted MPP superfamily phosphohydrolase